MQTCVRNERGQVIGRIAGDVLRLGRRRSRHWLRAVRGWAVDVAVLARAAALGVRYVEIRDTEAAVTYRAPLAIVIECGVAVDYGHGRQIALPECHWEKSTAMQLRLEV